MNKLFLLLSLWLVICLLDACQKTEVSQPAPSSVKNIDSFYFRVSGNPGLTREISGEVRPDSVLVTVPMGTVLTQLVPDIAFAGDRISPANRTPQNFSSPVVYTITAADGSTRAYTVKVDFLSNLKRITSFVFKATDHAGLTADIAGTIGGDTIIVFVPPALNITQLKPSIVYEGKSITPSTGVNDFTNPVLYEVKAADGSTKKYTVIVSKNVAVFFGSSDGYLYSVNAATGSLYWKFNMGSAVMSLTVSGGVVYASNYNGYLYALDAATGVAKWSYYKSPCTFTIPTVHNNRVYAGFDLRNGVHSMLALNATNGQLVWEQQILYNGYAGALYHPTLVNGVVYITSWSYGVFAYDAVTGALKWKYNAGTCSSSPAVVDGVVYVGSELSVLNAINAATGTLKWSYSNNTANVTSGATVVGDVVYIGAYLHMYAINKADGTLKWRYQAKGAGFGDAGGASRGAFSTPVVSNGVLYAGNNDFLTYAIDAATGLLKVSYPNSLFVKNTSPAPVVANGMVYTNREDKNLYVFNADLALRWTFLTNGMVNTNACVVDVDGQVFHTGDSGDQQ